MQTVKVNAREVKKGDLVTIEGQTRFLKFRVKEVEGDKILIPGRLGEPLLEVNIQQVVDVESTEENEKTA